MRKSPRFSIATVAGICGIGNCRSTSKPSMVEYHRIDSWRFGTLTPPWWCLRSNTSGHLLAIATHAQVRLLFVSCEAFELAQARTVLADQSCCFIREHA